MTGGVRVVGEKDLLVSVLTDASGLIVFGAIDIRGVVKGSVASSDRSSSPLVLEVPAETGVRLVARALVLDEVRTLFHAEFFQVPDTGTDCQSLVSGSGGLTDSVTAFRTVSPKRRLSAAGSRPTSSSSMEEEVRCCCCDPHSRRDGGGVIRPRPEQREEQLLRLRGADVSRRRASGNQETRDESEGSERREEETAPAPAAGGEAEEGNACIDRRLKRGNASDGSLFALLLSVPPLLQPLLLLLILPPLRSPSSCSSTSLQRVSERRNPLCFCVPHTHRVLSISSGSSSRYLGHNSASVRQTSSTLVPPDLSDG